VNFGSSGLVELPILAPVTLPWTDGPEMRESSSHVFPSASTDTSRYQVRLLADVELTSAGVAHRIGEESQLLVWSRVRLALTAEVGEPDGIRTVVFDLVLDGVGEGWEVCRFDTDPYDDAMAAARAIETGIGADQ